MDIEDSYARVAGVEITSNDVPGQFAISVYLAGCSIKCKGCQNADLQSPESGRTVPISAIKEYANDLCDWVALLGGEPTDQPDACIGIASLFPEKKIMMFTGREFLQLNEKLLAIPNLWAIKTGRFMQNLMMVDQFPCTTNQQLWVRTGPISSTDHWNHHPSMLMMDAIKLFKHVGSQKLSC